MFVLVSLHAQMLRCAVCPLIRHNFYVRRRISMHINRSRREEMKSLATSAAATTDTQRERTAQMNSREADRPAPSAPVCINIDHIVMVCVGVARVTIGAYCATEPTNEPNEMNRTIYDVLWVAAVFRFLYLFIILMR